MLENPTYEEVCKGQSKHAEVVNIYFNPDIISYLDLLEIFWNNHNPTTKNRQGIDVGTQYRSVVFFHSEKQMKMFKSSLKKQSKNWNNPIVTQIISAEKFYRAEEYHQDFYKIKLERYLRYKKACGREELLKRIWSQ